jgi:hypothetical protein
MDEIVIIAPVAEPDIKVFEIANADGAATVELHADPEEL